MGERRRLERKKLELLDAWSWAANTLDFMPRFPKPRSRVFAFLECAEVSPRLCTPIQALRDQAAMSSESEGMGPLAEAHSFTGEAEAAARSVNAFLLLLEQANPSRFKTFVWYAARRLVEDLGQEVEARRKDLDEVTGEIERLDRSEALLKMRREASDGE